MSDTPDTEDPSKKRGKGKEAPTDRDKAEVLPTPKDEKLFAWLENLFFGADQFPEYLRVVVTRGPTVIRQVLKIDYPASKKKPVKEEIVQLSNQILYRVQLDCDVQRKSTAYRIDAVHFKADDQPYDTWPMRRYPGPALKNGEDGEAGDEEETLEKRLSAKLLAHEEQMVGLVGNTMENLVDRQDRLIERLYKRITELETQADHHKEQIERLQSANAEREERRMWTDMKIKNVGKLLDMGTNLAPVLANQLVGKQVFPTSETAETITLKNFFKSLEEGGPRAHEQINIVFGVFDEKVAPPNNVLKPGILTVPQGDILLQVARCQVSADALDQLMPGGAHAITPEQVMALQQVFSMDQLGPLFLVFEARRKKAAG